MDITTVEKVSEELAAELNGAIFGRIFQLSRFEFAVDFRAPNTRYLFISVEPTAPRAYLMRRRLKDLERASQPLSPFGLLIKKELSGARVLGASCFAGERVLQLHMTAASEHGGTSERTLSIQLTGRSANLFLLDEDRVIVAAARASTGMGQEVGHRYAPPVRPEGSNVKPRESLPAEPGSISDLLDRFYSEKIEAARREATVRAARDRFDRHEQKLRRLLHAVGSDLESHGVPEQWKNYGDLLLANTTTAARSADAFLVTDYFADPPSQIAIPTENNESVTEAAERYFRKYTRARNAREKISERKLVLQAELTEIEERRARLEEAIAAGDEEALGEFLENAPSKPASGAAAKAEAASTFARKFISSDGYEILVGKRAKDNDHLTFRVARSLDTWMHAADYPGSHVVVRNPRRGDIPHRTLLEAAQLAAFYSQGKKQVKAAVHYTLKKFVNKPRGAAPGLVSLASFKTLLVEPSIPKGLKKEEDSRLAAKK
jgi:predicted ribosome quality control (RQC) complex YloA/Tae2 family protein